MKRHQTSMLRGPILSGVIRYAIPIILTSVLQVMFNMADIAVIGQRHGGVSVAAVGATSALTALIVNVFMGFSVGAGISVAHAIGGRKETEASHIVHVSIPLALVCGAVVTVIGVVFCRDLLVLMGTPKDILALSTLYMRIYFAGMTFTMVYNFCAAILRAAGDTKSPLIFLGFSGVLNVGLNLAFVYLLGMNVEGVALATVISQGVSSLLVVITLMRRTDCCRLRLKRLRFHSQALKKVLRLGLPAGLQSFAFSVSNVLINSAINSFGTAFVSGSSAASNPENVIYFSMAAFQQTAMNFTGQNMGAGQYKRVRKITLTCMSCSAVVGIVLGALTVLFGEQILSLYIPGETQAIRHGMVRLMWISGPYCICGVMEVATGVLRGMGSAIAPTVIMILGVCVMRIVWILALFSQDAFHTPNWLFASYPVSWAITLTAQVTVLVILYKKITKGSSEALSI